MIQATTPSFSISAVLRKVSLLFAAEPVRERGTRWEKRALLVFLLLGAIVRFWGVGSYGLHKPDEDTTALPAVHILQDGTPRFPGGMLYTRAVVQSYLIAASVMAFGQTEWALRLPSVLCGLLVIGLAYLVGRRFLTPAWNIALVAVVSFLPGFILDSQEVRMYIFLLASLALYAALIFAWERTDNLKFLAAAVVAMMLGIQFQQLAIFGSLLIFFPGLAHGDTKKFSRAVIAFIPIALYFVYVRWTPGPYPQATTDQPAAAPLGWGHAPLTYGLRFQPLLSALAVLAGVAVVWRFVRVMTKGCLAMAVGALLFLGLIAQAGLFYHVALLSYLAGVVLAQRYGSLTWMRLATLAAVAGALAAAQVWMLHQAGAGPLWKIAGVMVGQPSVWPYLQVGAFSPVAAAITAIALALALWMLAHFQPIPQYWLFFLLAVWVPLFASGLTGWYFPPRYAEFALLPLLITALAACQRLLASRGVAGWTGKTGSIAAVAAALCAVAIINPVAAARAVNSGDSYPDHRGAAVYMRSLKLGPKDIVLAEEVLMQTYYLGHVDYWLVSRNVAAPYLERVHGKLVDQYTHTPVISTAEEFRALMNRPDRGAIYVIGSGESQVDGRRFMRGEGIFKLLQSDELKVVYVARDGLTKVWKVEAPGGSN